MAPPPASHMFRGIIVTPGELPWRSVRVVYTRIIGLLSRCSQAKHCVNMKGPGWEVNQSFTASTFPLCFLCVLPPTRRPSLFRPSALIWHVSLWRGQWEAWHADPQYGSLHTPR
jgi:hypothetical protein